jgi:superfamily II DNA or RNA helicase
MRRARYRAAPPDQQVPDGAGLPRGTGVPHHGADGGPSAGEDAAPGRAAPGVRLRLRGNDLLIQFAGEAPAAGRPAPGSATAESRDASLRAQVAEALGKPSLVYDRRLGGYRTLALAYRSVRERLERERYQVATDFDPTPSLPFEPRLTPAPRPYQLQALAAWTAAGGRGLVVLPTGSGKTLVGLLAIARLRLWTLIVVPTLDLLTQWHRAVIDFLSVPPDQVGIFGGGRRDLAPITIITYDSAAIHTRELNRFGLLLFDEVHHLPAASYRLAAEGTVAPYRLGLSATPERTDGLERDLQHLVGPVVFARSPNQLQEHLAAFREERITIALTPEEQARYQAAMGRYRSYLRRHRLRITSPEEFQRWVIWPSATNPEARGAMLAHREARRLAFNATAKMATLIELLQRHRDDRVLIFSEFNAVVEGLSHDLLIPSITHKTPPAERTAILDGFRAGRFTKLATGRVLNEGVDVPDASVAIVLSGSGTRREYVQRLGRVLRPKAGPAVLYELVTEETGEVHLTRRRHQVTTEP